MKRTHIAALLIAVISLLVGFFSAWVIFRPTPFERDVCLSLDDDVRAFLKGAKENLARGVESKVEVGGVAVSASRITSSDQRRKSVDQQQYFLFLPDWPKPKFPSLSGLLTLRKTDAKHADIVFRAGVLQLGFMDIGICIDDYDLGAIAWGSSAETNVSNGPPTISNTETLKWDGAIKKLRNRDEKATAHK